MAHFLQLTPDLQDIETIETGEKVVTLFEDHQEVILEIPSDQFRSCKVLVFI